MNGKIKISLATKFAATFTALFLFIMLIVTIAVRQTITDQFTSQYHQGIESTLRGIQQDLFVRRTAVGNQLRQLAAKIENDLDFRLYAILLRDYRQKYIVDYAQNYMATMNLQALELTNHNGTVLSSGHQRYAALGRHAGGLIHQLQALGSRPVLAWFQDVRKKFLCFTVLDSIQLGPQKFYFIGGAEVTSTFLHELQHEMTEILILELPDRVISSSPQWGERRLQQPGLEEKKTDLPEEIDQQYSAGIFALPVVSDKSAGETATLYLLHPKTELTQVLKTVNLRILLTIAVGVIIAIVLSVWRTRAFAKPLQRLATTAGDLSLDKLDVKFEDSGNDEVGVLNEAMRKMVRRLQQSRIELAAAEQKAAMVEIARQVNHDIKNGFIPINNVMQHWMEVADNESEKLVQVFNERKTTVLESLEYLENLARSYSRLRPNVTPSAANVNHIVRDLLKIYDEVSPHHIQFQTHLDPREPCVQADVVQLRRAFENVLRNAMEAIPDSGTILVSTEMFDDEVSVTWKDSGSGIPENIRQQLFVTYVTTKPNGTGLGLVNVKRIVEDFGGTVSIQSEVGRGTTVRLIFPRLNGTFELNRF